MKADFCVIVYNTITRAIPLVEQAKSLGLDCFVMDNMVNPERSAQLAEALKDKATIITNERNLFFTASANKFMSMTTSDIVFFACGEHTEIKDPSWITDCVKAFEANPLGAVNGCVKYTPGFIHYKSIGFLPPEGPPHMHPPQVFRYLEKYPREVVFAAPVQRYVPAGFFGIRKTAYEKIGPFDENILHVASDVEYSLRTLMSGFVIGGIPGLFCVEKEGEPEPPNYRIIHSYHLDDKKEEGGEKR